MCYTGAMTAPKPLSEQRRLVPTPERVVQNEEDESALAADERGLEQLEAQQERDAFLEEGEQAPTSTVTPQVSDDAQAAIQSAVAKDPVTLGVEKILEDGLGEYVSAMPEEARVRFLYKGQETAEQVSGMVKTLKVHAKKVVELIRAWLLTIPGVNKFFLEQEAKIKTDKVLELEREYREKNQNQT